MNTLHEIGMRYRTDKATAHQYLDFYEWYIKTQGLTNPSRVLEIGVKDGASLKMWRDYFPTATQIIGIDVNPPILIPGCTVLQMDSRDVYALAELGIGFDLIIDDGGHTTLEQQIAFSQLYFHQLNRGGIYIMEDMHTSQYKEYVNSKFTTEQMMQHLAPHGVLFQRIPGDKSDSNTYLIVKP